MYPNQLCVAYFLNSQTNRKATIIAITNNVPKMTMVMVVKLEYVFTGNGWIRGSSSSKYEQIYLLVIFRFEEFLYLTSHSLSITLRYALANEVPS